MLTKSLFDQRVDFIHFWCTLKLLYGWHWNAQYCSSSKFGTCSYIA